MPKKTTAFIDAKGNMHQTLRGAAIADLAGLLGSAEGMAVGIASTILAKREEIRAILDEFDTLAVDDTSALEDTGVGSLTINGNGHGNGNGHNKG